MSEFELYLRLGFEHILDPRLLTSILQAEGYDHLLFIVALVAVYRLADWRRVLLLVTAFTIGHSLTLFLSTMEFISLPASWIELAIPLTIFLTALFNMTGSTRAPHPQGGKMRYLIAMCFGLIHGMGFSNYLRSLLGDEESLLLPLLAFNVGLEVGQIIIVLIVLFIHFFLARLAGMKPATWTMVLSILVLLLTLPILYAQWMALIG